jgi:hypothetical protein
LTRVYESNGPDVKIRGTAHHIAEKYLQLARDAQASGDPVTAENHYQHAEHYFRLIAAAQEQFRQQNPYYQPPASPGDGNRDDPMEGDDDADQPMQGQQPTQGQPNFGNQQPFYSPRDQSQPYGGQQPPQQGRPHNQPHQQHQPQQYQPQYQPQTQPPASDASDVERLPSFITGGQPQQGAPAPRQNGHDGPPGGDRYPRHRRRRHRSGGAARPDMPNASQEFSGDDGVSDDSRPDNS